MQQSESTGELKSTPGSLKKFSNKKDFERVAFLLSLGDDSLIMSQRLSEWTGHGPALEQDIAMTNIALDYLGQARNFYQHLASLANSGIVSLPFGEARAEASENSIAYLRDAHQYRNHLLTELPNGDWAQTILKIFLFAAYQKTMYTQLLTDTDPQVAAIAEKSLKEVNYHLRWSSDWVIRLGDGTEESNKRMTTAINFLWDYTGELFELIDGIYSLDSTGIEAAWKERVATVFEKATLTLPVSIPFQKGGINGIHTEHLGFILAEMQYLQRVYPNSEW